MTDSANAELRKLSADDVHGLVVEAETKALSRIPPWPRPCRSPGNVGS